MCVLSIKMSIRKKSANLFKAPRVCIRVRMGDQVYIYIYQCVLCVTVRMDVCVCKSVSEFMNETQEISPFTQYIQHFISPNYVKYSNTIINK